MEKTLIVETIECRRRREDQRMRWLYGISDSMDMNVGKFQELVRYREDWLVAVHKVVKNQTQLGDWTAITISYLYICFPGGSLAKNLPASAGDIGLIPELERSPGEGNDSPRQYSCMPNLMDRGAWRATVDVVAKDSDSLATKQQQQWQIPWYVYIFQYIYIGPLAVRAFNLPKERQTILMKGATSIHKELYFPIYKQDSPLSNSINLMWYLIILNSIYVTTNDL